MAEREQSSLASPSFIASAALLCVIVAAAIVIIAMRAFGAERSVAAARPAAAARAIPVSASDPYGCALRAGSQAVPQTTPQGGSWVTVGDMQEPQAPSSIGPERRVDGVGVCFQHSPIGGLYAAVNFFAQGTAVSQAKLLELLAVPSRWRAQMIAQGHGQGALIQDDDGDPGAIALAGFRVSDYTPAAEDLTLVLAGPGDTYAAIELSERWQGRDWKMQIPAGGQLPATAADSLAGFIPWSAQ